LKQRVEDAVSATRAAMEEGIVPGGGIALFNVSESMNGELSPEVGQIVKRAVESPLRAIISNSGESPDGIIQKLKEEKQKSAEGGTWLGFNAVSNKIMNLKEAGIIDPLKVVKTAFINAVSVAANYLVIGAAVTEIPEKKEKSPMGGGMGMGEDY
jgi:chaperonin GroEL